MNMGYISCIEYRYSCLWSCNITQAWHGKKCWYMFFLLLSNMVPFSSQMFLSTLYLSYSVPVDLKAYCVFFHCSFCSSQDTSLIVFVSPYYGNTVVMDELNCCII